MKHKHVKIITDINTIDNKIIIIVQIKNYQEIFIYSCYEFDLNNAIQELKDFYYNFLEYDKNQITIVIADKLMFYR